MKMATSSGKRIFGWACFDFANSAFHTLVVTFVYATFFTDVLAADRFSGTEMWGRMIAVSSVCLGILSPILGAIADAYAWKKRLMFSFVLACAACCAGLYFPYKGDVLVALLLVGIANVAIELSIVFNNSFLPEIAPKEKQGRVSGLGWSFGYVGGLLCLVVALVGFVETDTPWFGFLKERHAHVRATNLLVGVWVILFSIPMMFWVREKKAQQSPEGLMAVVGESISRLSGTFQNLRSYKNIFWLLMARLLYNDGLATVFAFGAIFASGTFGFEMSEVLVFGIVLNVCSGLGALGFSFFEDRIGSRRTITITLVFLSVSSLAATLVATQTGFWVCAIVIGLFIGPNQSASRAFLSRIAPEDKVNEFFGFFAMSGKLTAFIGPLAVGWMTSAFESQRVGMSIVSVMFVAGLALLLIKTKEN